MKSTLHMLLPWLLVLLAAPAFAQEIVEAKGTKADLKAATARAEKAWQSQDWKAAADAYAEVVEIAPDDGMAWHHLGYSLHALGRLDEALKAHVKAAEFPDVGGVGAYNAACVHALQGRKDDAFRWLEKARKKGFANAEQLAIDSDMDSLRDDPRFAKLVESMGDAKGAPAFKAYVVSTERAGARLLYWGQSDSPGQISIDYGKPVWKPEYAAAIESEKLVGKRWRLGRDFWTTFDTNLPLRVGDAELAPGAYYLTLEKTAEGAFVLAFNDPAKIRAKKIDAYLAHMTKGGIEVEMLHETTDKVAEELMINLATKKDDARRGALTIQFGPHVLIAPFEVALGT